MTVRSGISKRSHENTGDCEQSKRKESIYFSGKCDINSSSDKGIIRNYDKIIQIHFKHFNLFYLVFLGVGETIVGWLLCCCVAIAPCLSILLMCHVIHDFHNGGPLGRSGNESHQSEASKATVTKTIQNKSKRRDATRSNLTDLSTAGI